MTTFKPGDLIQPKVNLALYIDDPIAAAAHPNMTASFGTWHEVNSGSMLLVVSNSVDCTYVLFGEEIYPLYIGSRYFGPWVHTVDEFRLVKGV